MVFLIDMVVATTTKTFNPTNSTTANNNKSSTTIATATTTITNTITTNTPPSPPTPPAATQPPTTQPSTPPSPSPPPLPTNFCLHFAAKSSKFQYLPKTYFILFWPYLGQILLKFNDLGHFSTAKTKGFLNRSIFFKN